MVRLRLVARPCRVNDERGSILPLLAVVVAGFVLSTSLVVLVADQVVTRARAQSAADAAALAGAAAGAAAAQQVAAANGAEVVAIEAVDPGGRTAVRSTGGRRVSAVMVVSVEVDGVSATAAAARFWTGRGIGPYPVFPTVGG